MASADNNTFTKVKKTFPVLNMTCASCATSAQSILEHQPGVINAAVNYANTTANIEFDPTVTNTKKLKEVLQGIGYDLMIDESEDAKATRQIETAKKEAVAEAELIKEFAANAKMDLRGVKCPINFVRTKLKLEMMDQGEVLEVLLDEGEPAKNVPRSVKDEGHQILTLSPIENYFKLVIKKA